MQTISTPQLMTVPTANNLTNIVLEQEKNKPENILFSIQNYDKSWKKISAKHFATDVKKLAKGLIASNIKPGDRVAIMSKNRYEWVLIDFAIWFAGAISVPIYETSSLTQINWNLSDSSVKAIFVETDSHLAITKKAAKNLPKLEHIWEIEANNLKDLFKLGEKISDEKLEQTRKSSSQEDPATIIYTSGTLGRPKGCILTHGNFLILAENCKILFQEIANPTKSTLIFLPLSHVFSRFISILTLTAGMEVGHVSNFKDVVSDFASFKPTFMLAVPRVFEKIYNSAEQKAINEKHEKIFSTATKVAIEYSKQLDAGKIKISTKILHKIFDKLVYKKIRAALGGNITHALSGGAPLAEHMGHFFRGTGIKILEGYGLTETTAPICVNTLSTMKIGTVGIPLPGVSIKLAEDGEILAQGINIMKGYWNNPEATKKAIIDNWLHTGDIGQITEDGLLKITGRKKEIIITANGKNVVPSLLEDRIRSAPLVSQCVIIGEKRKFIAALITLDEDILPSWLTRHNINPKTELKDLTKNSLILKEIQKNVDEANELVSKAESIKKFVIVAQDFTESSGHLTPSFKIKRSQILEDFANLVEEIYKD